jgi:Concanavalin A-like lectin/glucanases superfamily
LASGIAFPVRPSSTDYYVLSREAQMGGLNGQSNEPIQYAPQHAMHNYTMQFSFQIASDGTLAAIALEMNRFLTLEVMGGVVHLLSENQADMLTSSLQVTDGSWHDAALTYSYVRQKLSLYVDGALAGEHDVRDGTSLRELFPQSFVLGGPARSGRAAAPSVMHVKDLFINRAALHAREIEERAKTDWVGAGSLDVYAPLRSASPTENRAQTLQTIRVQN